MARLHVATEPELIGTTPHLTVWQIFASTDSAMGPHWHYRVDFAGGPFITLTPDQWSAVAFIAMADKESMLPEEF